MTVLIGESGAPLGYHGRPEDAVDHAFDLAVLGQPSVIILPGGRCWWLEQNRFGLWKLEGADHA